MNSRRHAALSCALLLLAACTGPGSATKKPLPPAPSRYQNVAVLDGVSGEQLGWQGLIRTMDEADIIVLGEIHKDGAGHALQTELISIFAQRWPQLTVGLEEFDRSQQPALDAFMRFELTGEDLKAERQFVDPAVKRNWQSWYLPKLVTARADGAAVLATNAPLAYSRRVRNEGCAVRDTLPVAEQELFDCPLLPEDVFYKNRFSQTMRNVSRSNQYTGMKVLQQEQIDRMFRAHRVWDATMAQSIADARAAGAGKVLQLVGSFHSDYNGGLVQELRARSADSTLLVISFVPRNSQTLLPTDQGKANLIIYTRSR